MSPDRTHRNESSEESLARLIAAAGARADVSEVVEPMRSEVRAAWLAGLERERQRRAARRVQAFAIAAAVLLLLAAGWVVVRLGRDDAGTSTAAITIATALRVVGDATVIGSDGVARALAVGGAVHAGESVETASGSRAALALGPGRSLRLDRGTALTVLGGEEVALTRGEVYVDSDAEASGSLTVATAVGLVREVGTRFSVALDGGALAVRVRDGTVVLESAEEDLTVVAGEELTRDDDGQVARRPLPPSDPSWEWVVRTALPFELEGRTVAEYLDWLSRETGWRVAYASDQASRAASSTVLHGSLAGDDPRETLEAVLPSADLAYRLDGAVLYVGE